MAKKTENTDDFVVVDINNSQEKVSVGDIIEVQKINGEPGDKITFDSVLLSHISGKTVIGKPNIDKSSVSAEIVEQTKGDKVHSRTYKAKARYRRHVGNRQQLTKLKITGIK